MKTNKLFTLTVFLLVIVSIQKSNSCSATISIGEIKSLPQPKTPKTGCNDSLTTKK